MPATIQINRIALSLAARSSAFSILLISLSMGLCPPFHALLLTLALPASVTGPVDRVHGLHFLMASACRCLLSKLQPFAIAHLQYFVWH